MKLRCPACGTSASLDVLLAHDGARDALAQVFRLSGALGGALVRYLGLFRPEARELSLDRVARLLSEVLPDLQAGRITRKGAVHDAPPEAWIWAIEQAVAARDSGRLALPLKGHGWLYEVISTWRPVAGQALVTTNPAAIPTGRGMSRTLSAIAALENRANG